MKRFSRHRVLFVAGAVLGLGAVLSGCSVKTGSRASLGVSPASLPFAATRGDLAPAAQGLQITNPGSGNATLCWSLFTDRPWLTATPSSGNTTTETDVVTVQVDTSGLAPGTYTGTITVADPFAAGSPRTVGVTLNVAPTFSELAGAFVGLDRCCLAWGDFDDDGDLDLALAGTDGAAAAPARIYRNDGSATFTDLLAGLTGVTECALAWGDWDNDGDLDIALAGLDTGTPVTKIYTTGLRRIPALGNAQQRTSWTLRGMPSGTYTWSVQAIDSGFAGSSWAPEQTITVP